ncbi:hypothetical protein BDD43_4411 [Mucilaginibacter gracilis]|uniref:Uncharacterized protein n=1 Tax=Mucilaginibacter gracilis TaxID=423350 RepID=A0A495J735_9SPHI|nr:hypothetical protein BDD43_4411 [Mucilaginibacter gracilis]
MKQEESLEYEQIKKKAPMLPQVIGCRQRPRWWLILCM